MTPLVFGLVLISALIHALWSFFIKGSRDPLAFNLVQAMLIAVAAIFLVPFIDTSALTAEFGWLLLVTGAAHAIYLYGLSLAFAGGDLTLVYPVARSTPAFLPLIAVPLTGERLSPGGLLGIAIVVAGMWAVQLGSGGRAGGAPDTDVGVPLRRRLTAPPMRFAYLALVASVAYGLLDKAIMGELTASPQAGPVPISLLGFFAMWCACTVFFAPMALRRIEPGSLRKTLRSDWRSAGLAALISVAGYGLILKAYETAPASYVVAVRQSSVLFVLLLSVAFLGERPGVLRVAGAVATVAGVATIAATG